MKKLFFFFAITFFSLSVYSQAIIVNVNEIYKTMELNPYRAADQMAGWENSLVELNGVLGWFGGENGIFEMLFSYKGKTCIDNEIFSLSPTIRSIGIKTKVNNLDFMYNLNKGDNISIKGYLRNVKEADGTVGCMYFLIDLISVNNIQINSDQSLKPNISDNNNLNDTQEQYEAYFNIDQLYENSSKYLGKVIKFTGQCRGSGYDYIDFKVLGLNPRYVRAYFDSYFNTEDANKIDYRKDITVIGTLETREYCFLCPDLYLVHSKFSSISDNDINNVNNKMNNSNNSKDIKIYESFIDEKDNSTYKYIKVGNLYWMTENYAYNYDCYKYENENQNRKYGRLYSAEDIDKLTPKGWRLPTNKEFEDLIREFGGKEKAYSKLIVNGISGLNFVLGGCVTPIGEYQDVGVNGFYWTKDKINKKYGFGLINVTERKYIILLSSQKKVNQNNINEKAAMNVRFVKDAF